MAKTLTGRGLRHAGGDHVEEQVHVAADQRGQRLGRALERHVQDVDAGALLEQFAGQVRRGAGAEGGEGQLARVLLGVVDQIPGAGEGPLGAGQQHQRADAHHADRREAVRVIGQFLVQVAVGDQRRVGRHQYGSRQAPRATKAAPMEVPAPALFSTIMGWPRSMRSASTRVNIGGAARRERRDHLDRTRRIGVGLRAQRGRAEQGGGKQFDASANHVFPMKSVGRILVARPGRPDAPWAGALRMACQISRAVLNFAY